MIKEYLLKKALDEAFNAAKSLLKESGSKLDSTTDDIQDSINYHLRSVENWSSEVSFNDLKNAKRTTDIFIELDLYVQPRRMRIHAAELIGSIPLKKIFDSYTKHIVLLGQPGAGKTTSVKHLCQLLLHDDSFHSDRFSFPVLIRLRELSHFDDANEYGLIIGEIYRILGLKVDIPEGLRNLQSASERKHLREKLVSNLLEELKVLLILDGFDEIAQTNHREIVIEEIRNLANHLTHSTLILTSRTGEFTYSISNAIQFELCHLKREQISTFALKWLGDEQQAKDFLIKVYESPFADTAIRPLTLAHLCAIYERIGNIPDKPKTIYKKTVNLLLEEWDQQRSVKRISRYAHFEVDRKFEFLCHLSYALTVSLQKIAFSKEDLLNVYQQIYEDYDLVTHEAHQVVSELETHTGLLLQSGYDQFEFAHKSLQEYLTAEHLVKLPSIPTDISILAKIPNELAIAVTISSKPSDYFSELIMSRLVRIMLQPDFLKVLLNRLLLEKPDFNASPKVVLSSVLLYSAYVENTVLDETQSKQSLFHSQDLITEFEKLIKLILKRASINVIETYYKRERTYKAKDGKNIYRMGRKKRITDPTPQILADLPQTIFVRSSFLTEITNTSK